MKKRVCLYATGLAAMSLAINSARAAFVIPDDPVGLGQRCYHFSDQTGVTSSYNEQKDLLGGSSKRWLASKPNASNKFFPTATIHFMTNAPVVNGYTLVKSPSGSDTSARTPTAWNLYGKNDADADWTLLDARTGITGLYDAGSLTFVFENFTPYCRYKLEVRENNGDKTYVTLGLCSLHHLADTEVLEIGSSGRRIGTPSPVYGGLNGLAAGDKVTLDVAQHVVVEAGTSRSYVLEGLTISDIDGTVIVRKGVEDLPYEYEHAGEFRRVEWLWRCDIDNLEQAARTDVTVPSESGVNLISRNPDAVAYNSSMYGSALLNFDNDFSADSRFVLNVKSVKTNWVQYTFQEDSVDVPTFVTAVQLSSSLADFASRAPYSFSVSGSNTCTEGDWVELGRWSVGSNEAGYVFDRPFVFDAERPYSTYRVTFDAYAGTELELSEIQFFNWKTSDILRIKGVPAAMGLPTPSYGVVTGLLSGVTVDCSAPTETVAGEDGVRSVCVGNVITRFGDGPVTNDTKQFTYVHDGRYTELSWLWAMEYRQTFEATGSGSVVGRTGWFAEGETVTVTAVAGRDDEPFLRWEGDVPDGQEFKATLEYVADAPRQLKAVFASPIYVKPVEQGGDDGNDGTSWDAAVASVRLALERAQGAPVFLSAGTYPTELGELVLDSIAALFGPAGGGAVLDASGSEGPGAVLSVASESAVVSGVTIRGGRTTDSDAAGLRLTSGIVSNCVVESCQSLGVGATGGGVHLSGTGVFADTVVSNCTSAARGGGIYYEGGTFDRCTVVDCTSGTEGGGVCLLASANMTLGVLRLAGNRATTDGGGLFVSGELTVGGCWLEGNRAENGGGICVDGKASFVDCVMTNNAATTKGGAVHPSAGSPSFERCDFLCNTASQSAACSSLSTQALQFRCCRFVGNRANNKNFGGTLYLGRGLVSNCLFVNNVGGSSTIFVNGAGTIESTTIADNSPDSGRALYSYESGSNSAVVRNTILASNFIGQDEVSEPWQCRISYCCVFGHDVAGVGMINANPKLDSHYALRCGSPCIDAGINGDYTADSKDLAGNPRIRNFGRISARVDIGCYEYLLGRGLVILFR